MRKRRKRKRKGWVLGGGGTRSPRTVLGEQPQQGGQVLGTSPVLSQPHSCQQGGVCRKAGPYPHPTPPPQL